MPVAIRRIFPILVISVLLISTLQAVDKNFHGAPDVSKSQKNPYEGQPAAVSEGRVRIEVVL